MQKQYPKFSFSFSGCFLTGLIPSPVGSNGSGKNWVYKCLTHQLKVRDFKRELKPLLEDPHGVADQLDQFLGLQVYTWAELLSIQGILFSGEEKGTIRRLAMTVWKWEHLAGPDISPKDPWGLHKRSQRFNYQRDKKAVPRSENMAKAFDIQQGKEEGHVEFLSRVKEQMRKYSVLNAEYSLGQGCVTTALYSWPDIARKLQKLDNWKDRSIVELLREAQKVYMKRDEQKTKQKAKVMVSIIK
jgi:hypothetical protein